MKPALPADQQGDDILPSWVAVCPRGLWEVKCTRGPESGRGSAPPEHTGHHGTRLSSDYPRMGSLCRVRVRLNKDPGTGGAAPDRGDQELSVTPDQPITELTTPEQPITEMREMQPTPMARCLDSALQVPQGAWVLLRLGDGQCDITEGCVEMMRAGEACEVLLTPLRHGSGARPSEEGQGGEGDLPLRFTVELHAFTPGRESWEIPPGEKWSWVRSHKERGGVRFRGGDVWGAADRYSRALRLLITLQHHTRERNGGMEGIKEEEEEDEEEQRGEEAANKKPESTPTTDTNLPPLPTETEYRTIKAELHSNLSLCQLKLDQPERARTNAAKAALLEPGGAKAWYRLGQACLQVAELEEARKAFRKLLELQPDSPAAQRGLREVGSRERETNNQLGQRLSKMFS